MIKLYKKYYLTPLIVGLAAFLIAYLLRLEGIENNEQSYWGLPVFFGTLFFGYWFWSLVFSAREKKGKW